MLEDIFFDVLPVLYELVQFSEPRAYAKERLTVQTAGLSVRVPVVSLVIVRDAAV